MAQLKITLRSDLCAGSGESHGNTVDTDICMDSAGLPYLPARRIKGCLRQAADELNACGSPLATQENITALFGNAVGNPGCLQLQDARLPGAAAMAQWLAKAVPAPLALAAHPANVARLFTHVRGQTKLQDGVKVDGSLRFTRVLNHYTPLEPGQETCLLAELTLHSQNPELLQLLQQCCAATRHIGTHRNRGLGNVQLQYIAAPSAPATAAMPAAPADGMAELAYTVALDAPVTLPGCAELLTEIPARSVIGCMAGQYLKTGAAGDEMFRRLFLDGTVRWSALTPVVGGQRSTPTPLVLVRLKNQGRSINRLAEPGNDWKREKMKTLEGTYAAQTQDGYRIAAAATHTVYHHSHAQRTLYMQQALDAGQVYAGTVALPAALVPAALQLLQNAPLRFGRSRAAQYAACRLLGQPTVRSLPGGTVAAPGQTVYAVLQADMVLCADGCYTAAPAAVRAALAAALGVGAAQPAGTTDLCMYHTVSGYQTQWQLQKPPVPAVRGGSVFCFTAGEAPLPATLTLGEYRQEGFGSVRVYTAAQMQALARVSHTEVDTAPAAPNAAATAALQSALLYAAALDALRTTARRYAEELPRAATPDTGAIGRLRLMTQQAADYSDLLRRIDSIKASDVSSEKEKGRRDILHELVTSLCGKAEPEPGCLLRTAPALLPLLRQNPEVLQRVLASWKEPLLAALHWLYYNKNQEGGSRA